MNQSIFNMYMMRHNPLKVVLLIWLVFASIPETYPQSIHPDDIIFKRQATRRIVFDEEQRIPLSGLWPSKIVDMDVMHPGVDADVSVLRPVIIDGMLVLKENKPASAVRWVGGFNPFATYDLVLHHFEGSGQAGFLFRDDNDEYRISAHIVAKDGNYSRVVCSISHKKKQLEYIELKLPEQLNSDKPVVFRFQMLAVGANLFVEQYGTSILLGHLEIAQHLDLRRKHLFRRFEYCLSTLLDDAGEIAVSQVTSYMGPGIGQADVRFITYEDGSPFFMENRLWATVSVRGFRGGWPQQGVISIDPSVFDVRYEGLIVFDRNDGLLRNDIASNLFYDRNANEWRGFTTGFSAFGNPAKQEKKQILAVRSSRLPLKGFSIMQAEPTGLVGDLEDPQVIWDEEDRKWRMLICENIGGYKSVIRESDTWNGDYKVIAGPVNVNSTGTQIQKIGDTRYAIFGSSDRKVYVYSYPDLQPVTELNIYLPPWNESSRTRIWPNVMPLPEGYSSPYISLTMDRLNFPGMTGANWTYGALYLYHGFLKGKERLTYEFE